MPWPARLVLVADDELTVALGDEIELVLIGVRVRVLRLTRLEAVQTEHQAPALKQRRLELLVGIGADTIAVVNEIRHRSGGSKDPPLRHGLKDPPLRGQTRLCDIDANRVVEPAADRFVETER